MRPCTLDGAGRGGYLGCEEREGPMSRPVVGIIGNSHLINDQYPAHAGGTHNSLAVSEVCGAMPLLIPADPRLVSVPELLDACDGFLFTGGRPNVHPEEYGEAPTAAHGDFDRAIGPGPGTPRWAAPDGNGEAELRGHEPPRVCRRL